MKIAILLSVAATVWTSCAVQEEVQVEFVNAYLVRIDTVVRNADRVQMLIWKGSDNIDYVSYTSMDDVYRIGYRMPVMIRR